MTEPLARPHRPTLFNPGDLPMPGFSWQIALLTFVMSFALGGCGGNYKIDDGDYRPLGNPQATNRGK